MCDRIEPALIFEAIRLGLTDVRVDRTRRHPHLRATLPLPGAPRLTYAFPGSPSDRRSELNSVHQLRRLVRRAFEHRGLPSPDTRSRRKSKGG